MRELLYQAYLRYPRAFYDRHATGQVVSRATNDLYPIRYFIGWGLTQGAQSLMMIVGISVVLFLVNAKLAAIAICAMPLVGILTFSFARKVMPISRRVQQLQGRRHRGGRRGGRRASRWCRRSAARTTSRPASPRRPARFGTASCTRRASRPRSCPACSSCRRSRSAPSCCSAATT